MGLWISEFGWSAMKMKEVLLILNFGLEVRLGKMIYVNISYLTTKIIRVLASLMFVSSLSAVDNWVHQGETNFEHS